MPESREKGHEHANQRKRDIDVQMSAPCRALLRADSGSTRLRSFAGALDEDDSSPAVELDGSPVSTSVDEIDAGNRIARETGDERIPVEGCPVGQRQSKQAGGTSGTARRARAT